MSARYAVITKDLHDAIVGGTRTKTKQETWMDGDDGGVKYAKIPGLDRWMEQV